MPAPERCAPAARPRQIDGEHHLKTKAFQRARNGVGVVDRVVERIDGDTPVALTSARRDSSVLAVSPCGAAQTGSAHCSPSAAHARKRCASAFTTGAAALAAEEAAAFAAAVTSATLGAAATGALLIISSAVLPITIQPERGAPVALAQGWRR